MFRRRGAAFCIAADIAASRCGVPSVYGESLLQLRLKLTEAADGSLGAATTTIPPSSEGDRSTIRRNKPVASKSRSRIKKLSLLVVGLAVGNGALFYFWWWWNFSLNPMLDAVQKNDEELVRSLLEGGQCDPTQVSFLGASPMQAACLMQRPKILRLLLEKSEAVRLRIDDGLGVLEKNDGTGWTSLHKASLRGDLEIAKILVEFGAKVDAKCAKDSNFTPILFATKHGHTAIVDFLLTHQRSYKKKALGFFDPESYAAANNLLLPVAARYGHLETAKYLLSKKTSSHIDYQESTSSGAGTVEHQKNKFQGSGRTALHEACVGSQPDMVQFLLANGANPNPITKDYWNATALHLALMSARSTPKEQPRAFGDLSGAISGGGAAGKPRLGRKHTDAAEMVKALLSRGADPNQLCGGPHPITPLQQAVELQDIEAVKVLLTTASKRKLQINKASPEGNQTALHFAVAHVEPRGTSDEKKGTESTRLGIVRLLVAHGADLQVKTTSGSTPLALATSLAENDVVEFLSHVACMSQ